MRKMICTILAAAALTISCGTMTAWAQPLRVLFTHDIHSYLDITHGIIDGKDTEYGGAARLATLVKQYSNDHSVYLDGGDYAMGTLYQAGFAESACELRTLGEIGCDVLTFGNHEFDYGCSGITRQLRAAMDSGDRLPKIVEASFDFSGTLTEEQEDFRETLLEYGVSDYTVLNVNGMKVAVFGIEGKDSIECVQADLSFKKTADAAEQTLARIGSQADIIICLSHSGTEGDGKKGEDIRLAKEVSGIDLILSGHSHSTYETPFTVRKTILASCGEYLKNLGVIDLDVNSDGVTLLDYQLIPIGPDVPEDPVIREKLDGFKTGIRENYLKNYAGGGDYDDLLTHADFDMIPLEEMYAHNGEFETGNLIADAYLCEARRNGIHDIDAALVGLGTIRDSISAGPVTLADAFEICSLGAGADGSAGHPLLASYVTGKELKLLTELDVSLGSLVSSIRMSYSGLEFTYNSKSPVFNRVAEVRLVRPDGTKEEIENNRLYKVSCNMYAANMLGMLNGLTGGLLSITPKNAQGEPITDFYAASLTGTDGKEIKEWIALRNYLSDFGDNGIPEKYSRPDGRKNDLREGGLKALAHLRAPTVILIVLILLTAFLIVRAIRKKKNRA